jgi:hypothetical protein
MNVKARVSLRTSLVGSGFFGAAVLMACGGSQPPPPPSPEVPLPPPTVTAPPPDTSDAGSGNTPAQAATPTTAAPSVVASRQGTVRALGVEDSGVYWLTESGDLKRTQKTGGAALKVASFGADPAWLAFSGSMIFVTQLDSKAKACVLYRLDPTLSNKPDKIATQSGTACTITADSKRVAWGTQSGKKFAIGVVENGATTVRKLAPVDAAAGNHLTLGLAAVYFEDGGKITSLALTANAKPAAVASVAPQVVSDMVYAGDRLFVALLPSATDFENGSLVAIAAAGGAPTEIAKSQPYLWDIANDDTALYWVTSGTKANDFKDGTVMKLTIAGSAAPVVVADKQLEPKHLAIDDENIFFTVDKGSSSDADSDVLRVAK